MRERLFKRLTEKSRKKYKYGGEPDPDPNANPLKRGRGLDWLGLLLGKPNMFTQTLSDVTTDEVIRPVWNETLPLNVRQFTYDLFGGKDDLTEAHLGSAEKRALNEARKRAEKAGRNYITYKDWETHGEYEEGEVDEELRDVGGGDPDAPVTKFLDPKYALKTTFGRINFTKNDDGTYTFTDSYNFNDATGKGIEGVIEDIQSGRHNDPKYGGLYSYLRSIGRHFGSAEGEGSKVKITMDSGGLYKKYDDGGLSDITAPGVGNKDIDTGLVQSRSNAASLLAHLQNIKEQEQVKHLIRNQHSAVIEQKDRDADSGKVGDRSGMLLAKYGGIYDDGGLKQLPGGVMEPIPGSDAVVFKGATHDQGGIMVDAATEVEGGGFGPDGEPLDGETMDQVTVAKEGGKRQDYFFSSHLKKDGRTFADHHKDILAMGGTQSDIDYLAKIQEEAANRNPNKIGTAKLGGLMEYGGPRQYSNGGTFKATSDKANRIIEILKAQGYEVPDVADLGTEHISENQKYLGSGYYGEKDIKSDANRKDFYERNKDVLHKLDVDGDGTPDIDSWEDYNPKIHTGAFQEQFNKDMMSIFDTDPKLVEAFKAEGYTPDDLKQFGFYDSGTDADTGVDTHHGEYTWSRRMPFVAGSKVTPPEDPPEPTQVTGPDPCPPCPDGSVPTRDATGNCPCPETKTTTIVEEEGDEVRKDYTGALLGLGSMIPAVMAFTDKPDYMKQPDLQAPGVVKAERVAKQHLDRVDFNDQIARNASDFAAMNKFITDSGGGPSNIANKMSAYAAKQRGDRDIKAQEAKANIAIANEEAALDNKRKVYNAEAALDASKFNVSSQEKADMSNIKNKMYVDEFNRAADAATKDRKLNAVQYGLNTLVGLHRDKLEYQAADDYAKALDGTRGAYDRFFKKKNTKTTTTTTPAKRGGYRQLMNLRR